MAGYLMGLDSLASLQLYATNGVYATKVSAPDGRWRLHHEATFADYVTMRPGDNIYFFIERQIYGIGEMVPLGPSKECRYLNHPCSARPNLTAEAISESELLWREGPESVQQPWLCLFKPAPHLFTSGIDMDDMLSSNPRAFKMLRAFWKLSFLKFDDEENLAFKSALLKHNQEVLRSPGQAGKAYPEAWQKQHQAIGAKLQVRDHTFKPESFLEACFEGARLRHEMALEVGLLSQLVSKDKATANLFGHWDYLSHQVVASPFKPIDYMDKMDVFGYSFIAGYEPIRSQVLVAELKKDDAASGDLEQLMKYVDWIKDEYCYGDYSMIRAFLVAANFSADARDQKSELASRRYITGRRPAVSREWSDLSLVTYAYDPTARRLSFSLA
jgi:hypothetical protein